MKKQTHSLQIRIMSMLLALVCILGLFPGAALAASPDTIKLEDCTYNGVHYDSPALGICYMHQMQFDVNGDSVMGKVPAWAGRWKATPGIVPKPFPTKPLRS